MGQADVLRWLEEHPGWHSPDAIAEGIGVNASTARLLMRKLSRQRVVEKSAVNGRSAFVYRHLVPKPRGRVGKSVENRVVQAWRSGSVQVIGEDIFGNVKLFDLPAGHFQCKHCLEVVRIDERGYAACVNRGPIS